jgi:CCR4-NOT transcription complex subunit 3
MMESAYYHMPTPSDSERLRTYLHRQSVQTPQHFPQVFFAMTIMRAHRFIIS